MKIIIKRGLPGSGKSYWIGEHFDPKKIHVCSADHYHVDEQGNWRFDAKNNVNAHNQCLKKYALLLAQYDMLVTPDVKDPLVIVDNTNTTIAELAPYVRLAVSFNIEYVIHTHWIKLEDSIKNNIHNVPNPTLMFMYQNMLAERIPPYWNHEILLPADVTFLHP